MEYPFKNLFGAKEEYSKVQEEIISLREESEQAFAALDELKEAHQVALDDIVKLQAELKTVIEQRDEKNLRVIALTEEIAGMQAVIDDQHEALSELKKNQKTANVVAREIIAASGGAPVAVDNSEMEMTEIDLVKAMHSEKDPIRKFALYKQYKGIKN